MPSTPSSAPPDAPRRARLLLVAASAVIAVGGVTAIAVASGDDESASSPPARPTCPPSVAEAPAAPADGDPAPEFELPGLFGGCVRLASLEGQPVVVNFWASWCVPCREEFPMLRDAYDDHADEGLEIVGVTYRDIPDDSRRFAREQDAEWDLAIDDDLRVAQAYRVAAVPQTLFVRRDGTISAHVFGPLSRAELDQELAEILRG